MRIPHTLISTVGTSLATNLERDGSSPAAAAYRQKEWGRVATELRKLKADDRLCGAEINSIYEIVRAKRAEPRALHFCVSETEQGRNVGEILRRYYEEDGLHVKVREISDLSR
ncbi:MAG: hypothetical protein ACOX6T_12555 [Myxococcales bacterium]|jgi:CRISPR/Cas system-associated protein Csm6